MGVIMMRYRRSKSLFTAVNLKLMEMWLNLETEVGEWSHL